MTTTFENARIGDTVWSVEYGWGVIRSTSCMPSHPIQVKFDEDFFRAYRLDGTLLHGGKNRTLFWDEVKFEAPKKPLPSLEVDAKVLVWNRGKQRHNRHFSHFSASGKIVCFADGMTRWSTKQTTEWDNWELAE